MGRQRILYHIFIEKRGNTWEDRKSYVTSLQIKEEIHGKTENPMSIEKRGSLQHGKTDEQRKEEIHGKTDNPVSHLYREKRKYMGRQRILYYIFIEKRGNAWEDRESCITSLQRKEEIHGKTENPMSHLYREKRKYMGRQIILYHISIEKRGNTWEDIFIEKRGNTWEDRESYVTSLQIKEEIHGKTENPMSHLYREKRKYMGRQIILCHISIEKRGNTWEDR